MHVRTARCVRLYIGAQRTRDEEEEEEERGRINEKNRDCLSTHEIPSCSRTYDRRHSYIQSEERRRKRLTTTTLQYEEEDEKRRPREFVSAVPQSVSEGYFSRTRSVNTGIRRSAIYFSRLLNLRSISVDTKKRSLHSRPVSFSTIPFLFFSFRRLFNE